MVSTYAADLSMIARCFDMFAQSVDAIDANAGRGTGQRICSQARSVILAYFIDI